jgi:hypothetical protein
VLDCLVVAAALRSYAIESVGWRWWDEVQASSSQFGNGRAVDGYENGYTTALI